jgi:hypothetical protein
VIALLAIVCLLQAVHYRRYARNIIRPAKIEETIEYQEAQWLDRNMNGAPVMLPGSVSFWANAFTATPQMTGCCLQSLIRAQPQIFEYLLGAGHGDDPESADLSLLWLKACAVQAIAMSGPRSREHYRDYRFPHRFQGRLPLAWNRGDDYIYRVPERAAGLARIVREADIVRDPPASGIDVAELRPFVQALDDPSQSLAAFEWSDTNTARVTGTLAPGHVLSIAIAWDAGWSAMANGRAVPVRADGVGLIAIDPKCAGACEVRLHWSAGAEPRIVVGTALLTLIAMTAWCFTARPRHRFRGAANPGCSRLSGGSPTGKSAPG